MVKIHNRKPLQKVLAYFQSNLPENFEYCEENGFEFTSDFFSQRTLIIRRYEKVIEFKWFNNSKEELYFRMSSEEIEFVADLLGIEVYI